ELLAPLVESGAIGGFESPARFLPPLATQRARRDALPAALELRARLTTALSGLPVRAAVLEPFIDDVEAARHAPPVTPADLAGTSLGAAVDALLVKGSGGWSALLPVSATSGDLSRAAAAHHPACRGPAPHRSGRLQLRVVLRPHPRTTACRVGAAHPRLTPGREPGHRRDIRSAGGLARAGARASRLHGGPGGAARAAVLGNVGRIGHAPRRGVRLMPR